MSAGSYYVPASSKWPVLASLAMGVAMVGGGTLMVHGAVGVPVLAAGIVGIFVIIALWFSDVVGESRQGLYDAQMDRSFRWGMAWFIFSEVMFFAAFFGALFYVRTLSVPWLDGQGSKGVAALLWPDFTASWPLMNPPDPAISGPRETLSPWRLPLVNTLILVSSSIVLTISHRALKGDLRSSATLWLTATVIMGLCFIVIQGVEYYEAYNHYGITLQAGIYGSTFFILTGFHGLHVIIGTVILISILVRLRRGHFSSDQHFGFEAAAWYWHFVDVVWIGLFIFVYVF